MIPWQIEVTRPARKDLEDVPTRERSLIARDLDQLATNPGQTGNVDIRKLQGQLDVWRIRVGDWRAHIRFDSAARTITVLRVLQRKDAYRE